MPDTITTATLDSRPPPARAARTRLAAGFLGVLLIAAPNATRPQQGLLPHDTLAEILARGTLRVAVRAEPADTAAAESLGPSAIEDALARDFAAELGVDLEIVPAANSG